MDNFADGQKGALGDLRVLGTHVDNASKRFLPFKDGFPLMRESVFTDWGFSGPRVVKEYLGSIHESGTDIGNYHLQWVVESINTVQFAMSIATWSRASDLGSRRTRLTRHT